MYFCAAILLLVSPVLQLSTEAYIGFPYCSVIPYRTLVLITYPCNSDMAESSAAPTFDGIADPSTLSVQ